jgi:hypothetical protein
VVAGEAAAGQGGVQRVVGQGWRWGRRGRASLVVFRVGRGRGARAGGRYRGEAARASGGVRAGARQG